MSEDNSPNDYVKKICTGNGEKVSIRAFPIVANSHGNLYSSLKAARAYIENPGLFIQSRDFLLKAINNVLEHAEKASKK